MERELNCRLTITGRIAMFALVALFCCMTSAYGQQQQPAVHPFVQPPVLEETTPNAPAMKFLRAGKLPSQESCHPQGSVTRTGSDVYVKLNYVRGKFTINNPDPADPYGGEDPVELRSYGGCHAGPTLEVLPGNTLHFDLINSLSTNDPSCLSNPPSGLSLPAGVACFNTINLHTHGLHVSPAGNGDNVLLSIGPQTDFPYEINIPSDHPAGTFWYHAHRHGSTAMQVASGASGMLIIRGNRPYTAPTQANPHPPQADIDTVLHDAAGTPFTEQLFLLQQIPYACFSNPPNQQGGPWQQIFTIKGLYNINSNDPTGPANAPWVCPKPDPTNYASIGVIENFSLQMFSASIWDTNGRFTAVNGVVQPTITLKAGEIQRWRFVHAGIHDTINLQVVRATSTAQNKNLMASSALVGNRLQQKTAVQSVCAANKDTLVPQFEIAVDGLTRTRIEKIGDGGDNASNFMQPGYRSDVLLVFPSDGDYCLLDQAAPPSERFNPTSGKGGGLGPSVPQLLAYVHVRGGKAVTGDLQKYVETALYAANPTLPAPIRQKLERGDLTPWAPFIELAPPSAGATPQQAVFAINFPKFQVNNTSYDPNVVNITRQVNTTDDWLLTSEDEPHIYHIHVNPFEVIDVRRINPDKTIGESIFDKDGHCKKDLPADPLQNEYCSMYHVFRDTIFVEGGYQVRIRTYYDRYIGEYVLHCHILDHEDAGMMLNVQIVPDLNTAGGANMKHKQ
jgi:FtsP/CotA-like multicopper oxidase with cupredoxin domain